ncbi:MAG: tetratricopeptide repeat protein, partial [Gemmatimonadota bacterium]|nr:tetratricopeptide repeat protein [Gemmatimonadota bacterium]
FERPVAIKVVRAGLATEDVLERFRLERSILAGLNHPNLAQLIDGGRTDGGLPYFVMEFVEGVRITEYCDRNTLSVEARLKLFTLVCDAVQHAHRNLVVHRDIKPSNILVTPNGLPKLLDFGIGKVLDPSAPDVPDRTAMTQRVLTPEYAAPEQVRGGPITTATDVHGLGVLLYELLTGHHPFASEASSPERLTRAVLDTAPTSPSTVVGHPVDRSWGDVVTPSQIASLRRTTPPRLRRALQGDVDNIILMALRKEPERRYSSAEAFGADVQRHLGGRTVRARPDSMRYRLSKFVTRNPWAATAAVLAAVVLGASVAIPWQQNRRLTRERDKAREVQDFLLEAFGTTGVDESIGAGDLLDLQSGRIGELYPDRPELQAEMYLVLAEAYDRLGRYDEELEVAERGLDLMREQYPSDHPDLARALNTLGWALHQAGNRDRAAAVLENAVDMRRRLGRPYRAELARSLNDLGVVRSVLGESGAAEALHREAFTIRRAALGDSDRATGVSASNLAAVLYEQGEFEEARREAELALELLRSSVGPDHQRTIVVQNNLAVMSIAAGDVEGAIAQYRDLLDRQTRLQGAEHPVTNTVRHGLAATLLRVEQWEEAYHLAADAYQISRDAGVSGLERALRAHGTIVRALEGAGRTADALVELDTAIRDVEDDPRLAPLLQSLRSDRVRLLVSLDDWRGAAEDYNALLRAAEASLTPDDPSLAARRVRLAEYLARAGELSSADSLLNAARAVATADSASGELRAAFERVLALLRPQSG